MQSTSSEMQTLHCNRFDQRRIIVSRTSGESYVRDGRVIPKPAVGTDTIDRDGVATVLYSGTVYPPSTVFKDYAAMGMGGELVFDPAGRIDYQEPENLFEGAKPRSEVAFDAIDELARVLDASDVDFDNAVLLLSEGKDSTGIALALADLGKRVDCVTFANSDTNVEFVESLANRLGHRLRIIRYANTGISEEAVSRLGHVFEPTLDQAFLSYLLLPMETFEGRTLIDGMGNDVYMGHLPTKQQRQATRICSIVERFVPAGLRPVLKGRSFADAPQAGVPLRTFTECQGLYNGFSQPLVERSVGGKVRHLDLLDRDWRKHGYERGRALSRGRYIDIYGYSGKSVALAEMVRGRVYFPWADESLAALFIGLDDEIRFHWPTTNKLPLRQAIAKRIPYEQPKVGFRAPTREILQSNETLVRSVVESSEVIGLPLKRQLASLKVDSPRLVCGFLFALWEHASR